MIFLGQIFAISVMLLVWPRKRIEWATVSKSLAFAIVLTRALYIRTVDGSMWPPGMDLTYWVIVGLLILFFDVSVVMEWGKIMYQRVHNKALFYFVATIIAVLCSILLYYGIMV